MGYTEGEGRVRAPGSAHVVHVPGDALEAGLRLRVAGRVVRVQRLLHHLLLLVLLRRIHVTRWRASDDSTHRAVLSRVNWLLIARRRRLLVRAAALRRRHWGARRGDRALELSHRRLVRHAHATLLCCTTPVAQLACHTAARLQCHLLIA